MGTTRSERTTMTLDDDVVALIAAEMRRTGRAKKTVVNDAMRRGLDPRNRGEPEPFVVEARPMGLKRGRDLTSVSALLEQIEGPRHR